jgi:hypothetical protein
MRTLRLTPLTKTVRFFALFVFMSTISCEQGQLSTKNDPELAISISRDSELNDFLEIKLENSVFRAVIRARERFIKTNGKYDHCIRDWVIKAADEDQVEACIDGSAHRPYCRKAVMTHDDDVKKSVELFYGDEDTFVYEYTIYANNPVIEVDYISYGGNPKYGSWCNIVDIATPGGIDKKFTATTRIYGQENWVRDLVYHEDCYWSIHHDPKKSFYRIVDDASAGSLNYKDHLILVVGNPDNGRGFGRVIPIYREGVQGGVRVLKLLWDVGFEPFIRTGQDYRPSFKGYLFIFDDGLDQAIEMGKSVVDKALQAET